MIVVQLCGGLGNQLFQYAAGRATADRLGVELGLDLRPLRVPDSRPYGLGHFAIRATVVRDADLRALQGYHGWRWRVTQGLLERLRTVVRPSPPGHLTPVIHQGTRFTDVLRRVTDDSWLVGFWQSQRYFAEAADRLRADLRLTAVSTESAALERVIQDLDCPVAVHVRRGDYAAVSTTRAYHGLLRLEYYHAAMRRVREQHPEATFVLFSDEPDWVDAHLRPARSRLVGVNGDRPHEDLHLMACCRAHIVANSSFSWWGAWLARSELVIAPRRWFQAPGVDDTDIVPPGWLRL